MNALRGLLLFLGEAITVPFFAVLMVLCIPLGGAVVYNLARLWCLTILNFATVLGIRYTVHLDAPLPTEPTVVLVKHASAWETFFMMTYFPRLAPVVKKELLSIPFFGWGLALCEPIAIDRSSPRDALTQVEQQGRTRLSNGRWISIFPEGTRVPAGFRGRYAASGANIALKAQAPIIAVAHDAGYYWQRGLFKKQPGTIQVRISAPFHPRPGESAHELTGRIETWIEDTLESFGHPASVRYVRTPNHR